MAKERASAESKLIGIKPEQTLLVQAALGEGTEVKKKWLEWKTRVSFDEIDIGSMRLLPLVYRNLIQNGIEDELLPRLKGIVRKSFYRDSLLFSRVGKAMTIIQESGIDLMVLKGLPLCFLYYGGIGLRPMGDVDILVRPDNAIDTARLLTQNGWKCDIPVSEVIDTIHASFFYDQDGFVIDLHWRVFEADVSKQVDETFWKGSICFDFQGKPARTLNPTDHLLLVICHGNEWSSVSPVRWIADAILIMKCASVDWDRFVEESTKRCLTAQSALGLRVLQQNFQISVPEDAVLRLEQIPLNWVDRKYFDVSRIDRSKAGPFSTAIWIFFSNLRKNRGRVFMAIRDSFRMVRTFPFAENSYRKALVGSLARVCQHFKKVILRVDR